MNKRPGQDGKVTQDEPLREGIDFDMEDGLMVLKQSYLLRRGYCCGNGCRNCPYGQESGIIDGIPK